jgi:membrane protease YdiL (CAAX protease family)
MSVLNWFVPSCNSRSSLFFLVVARGEQSGTFWVGGFILLLPPTLRILFVFKKGKVASFHVPTLPTGWTSCGVLRLASLVLTFSLSVVLAVVQDEYESSWMSVDVWSSSFVVIAAVVAVVVVAAAPSAAATAMVGLALLSPPSVNPARLAIRSMTRVGKCSGCKVCHSARA